MGKEAEASPSESRPTFRLVNIRCPLCHLSSVLRRYPTLSHSERRQKENRLAWGFSYVESLYREKQDSSGQRPSRSFGLYLTDLQRGSKRKRQLVAEGRPMSSHDAVTVAANQPCLLAIMMLAWQDIHADMVGDSVSVSASLTCALSRPKIPC